MLFWITGTLALANLVFLLVILSTALFNIEGGWIREQPVVGIFFAYTTIFLLPSTIYLFTSKYNEADSQGRNNKIKFTLFKGFLGLLYLGIAHLTSGNDRETLALLWYIGVFLTCSIKNP
jgi:hypothetical protein